MPRFLRPLILMTCLLAVTACAGCATGNGALRAHTAAATTLDDIASDAKEYVLEKRQAVLDKAADDAHGLDIAVSVEDAAAAFDAGPAIHAVNAFIAAKDAYVRAVLASASTERPSWDEAKAMLGDVVDAYTAMRLALGEPKAMPPLPDAIAKLLTVAPRPTPVEAVA